MRSINPIRYFGHLAASAFGLAALLMCATAFAADKVETNLLTDNEKGFTIDVPKTWDKTEPGDPVVRFVLLTNGTHAADAQPPVFIVVVVGPDPTDDSLKTVRAFADGMKKQVAVNAPDIKYDDDKDLKLDGEPAIQFSYTKMTKIGMAKFQYQVCIHNGIGYSVSFACDPKTFDAEWPSVQPAFESFKWAAK